MKKQRSIILLTYDEPYKSENRRNKYSLKIDKVHKNNGDTRNQDYYRKIGPCNRKKRSI